MTTRRCAVLSALAIALGLFAAAASAEIKVGYAVSREFSTISTQPHPKKLELAYLATKNQRMEGEVIISYILNRENWSSCCDIDLESGGKMVGSLELITKGETQKIGKKRSGNARTMSSTTWAIRSGAPFSGSSRPI